MKFGDREKLFEGDWAASVGGKPVSSDGFLTVTASGEDSYWTYLVLDCVVNGETIGSTTWAYSSQMDFTKTVSMTIPLRKEEAWNIEIRSSRSIDKLKGVIYWVPLVD